jgi:hypothetical protein
VVPGGGLSPDGTKWVASRANFLVSIKVLSRLFRGKFLAGVKALYDAGELHFAGSTAALAEKPSFQNWLNGLYAKDWVVYAKKPFAGPEVLLKYLTRYTHRVALSNGRLKKVDGDRVTLSYKDYADNCRPKELTLTGVELLRRFALHVLPKSFVRVRQCGILAHRDRQARLALCRRLLVGSAPSIEPSVDTDRLATAPVEMPQAAPNAPPALSLSAVLFLALALGCDAMAALLACAASPPVRRCLSCGQGELQTIWEQPRPRGPQRKPQDPWNTS